MIKIIHFVEVAEKDIHSENQFDRALFWPFFPLTQPWLFVYQINDIKIKSIFHMNIFFDDFYETNDFNYLYTSGMYLNQFKTGP